MPEDHVIKLLDGNHKPMFLGHCGMTDRRGSALEFKSMEHASDVADEVNEVRDFLVYPAVV